MHIVWASGMSIGAFRTPQSRWKNSLRYAAASSEMPAILLVA
jgi:hypothetical protein